ncbi:hypothetical protein ACQKPX_01335 [Photobacterium sp. DNB23_23_1]
MITPYIATGELIHVLTDYQQQTVPLYAVYKESHSQPVRVRAFIDFIAERLSQSQ